MKTLRELQEEWVKKFDERFGKAGPEENCDSFGREAGCDDCQDNIELRKEHKSFLLQATEMVAREALRAVEVEKIKDGFMLFEHRTLNKVRDSTSTLGESVTLSQIKTDGYNAAITESERLKGEFLK